MKKQLICSPIDMEWAESNKARFEKDLGVELEIDVQMDCPPGTLLIPGQTVTSESQTFH